MDANAFNLQLLRWIYDIEDSVAENIEKILSDKDLHVFAQQMAEEIKADVFLLPYGNEDYANAGCPCWVIDSKKEIVMYREIKNQRLEGAQGFGAGICVL